MGQVVNMRNLSNPKSYELLKLKRRGVTKTKVKLMDFDLVQQGILNLFRDLVLG
jgi:hypothetical protein